MEVHRPMSRSIKKATCGSPSSAETKSRNLPTASFTEFEIPGNQSAALSGIAIAPDGSVWFGLLRQHAIGRLRDGQMKIFQLPRPEARPYTLAADKKGNIWYADISGYVGMLKAEAAKR